MKFKHTFHVFVDNFAVTYKLLLYRLIILVISIALYTAVLSPYVNALLGSEGFTEIIEGIKSFLMNLVEGKPDVLGDATRQIKEAYDKLLAMIAENRANIVFGLIAIIAVRLVMNFFAGLGNYATAAVINDKMAFRAQSPFILTLVHNLKEASLYNLIYVPLSLLYDIICFFIVYNLFFSLLSFIFLPLKIFLFVTVCVIAVSVKMMFTTDWLPSLIRGKAGQKKAFLFTFNRRRKSSLNVLSNFVVLILIIFAVNVIALFCTFGAAALISVPSSYVVLVSFEFVNYYDREELKYFIDKNTVVKPDKERTPTREEFFRGE